jgi:hypothetical protein
MGLHLGKFDEQTFDLALLVELDGSLCNLTHMILSFDSETIWNVPDTVFRPRLVAKADSIASVCCGKLSR